MRDQPAVQKLDSMPRPSLETAPQSLWRAETRSACGERTESRPGSSRERGGDGARHRRGVAGVGRADLDQRRARCSGHRRSCRHECLETFGTGSFAARRWSPMPTQTVVEHAHGRRDSSLCRYGATRSSSGFVDRDEVADRAHAEHVSPRSAPWREAGAVHRDAPGAIVEWADDGRSGDDVLLRIDGDLVRRALATAQISGSRRLSRRRGAGR